MTYWIDPVLGSDANNGQAATTGGGSGPKLTFQGGLGLLATGDTLNIINSGALQITQTTNMPAGCTGTSFTNFGALIRGRTVTDTPAISTITFDNSATARTMIGVRSGNQYIILRHLKFDRSVNTIASAVKNVMVINDNSSTNNAGPVLIEACISVNKVSTAISGQLVGITASTGVVPTSIEVRYCLFTDQGTAAFVNVGGESKRPVLFHHNIIILENGGTVGGQVNFGTNDADADVDHEYYNNTILLRSGRILNVSSNSTLATTANAAARKKFHSNVWANYSSTAGTDQVFTGSSTWEDTVWTGVRTIGNNVFVDGVDGGTFRWAANNPYTVPWDTNSSDNPADTGQLWATDVSTTSDPFNAKTTPWTWTNVNGLGADIPLSGDLRLIAHRTAGLLGVVPGAIEDSVADIDGPTTLTIYATVGQSVTENIAISNLGSGTLTISAIALSSPDASLTYGGPASDSLVGVTTELYPVTFAPTTHPTDVTATLTFTSDDSDEPSFVVTITARSVANYTPGGPPLSEDNPGYYLPPLSGVQASIELSKNTTFWTRHSAEVGDPSDRAVAIAAGLIHLPVSSGLIALTGLTLTGLNKLFIMVKGSKVNLRVGSSDHILLDGGCMLIANTTNLSTVLMENTSTMREAEVHFFGSKGS